MGAQFELEEGKVVTAIPGGGTLSAFDPRMTNADWNHSVAYAREAWNEERGVSHPGRGGYSSFFQASIYSTTEIPAGMEIFISYGENYEQEHKTDEEQLSKEDLEKVDLTVNKLVEFFEKHEDELDEVSKHEVYQFLIRDVMQAAAGPEKGKMIAEILPDTPDKLSEIQEKGGMIEFTQPSMVRSSEWLEQNGRCMDNIRPGPSTIPHAGRGAIANRAIKKGGLVAPVPLIQIPDEEVLQMYEIKTKYDEDEEEEFQVRGGTKAFGTQLLLNYCFGHPESPLLFFPAGAVAAFINHSKKPNAKLVWSDHPNNQMHWLALKPEELINEANSYIGLLMEVVATRDIKEGEEVFIDYGDLWQKAWDEHVKDWKKGQKSGSIPKKWPDRALDLNHEYRNKPLEAGKTYADNVVTKCFLVISKPAGDESTNEDGDKIRVWTMHKVKETFDSANLFDCSILEREEDRDGESHYTIKWVNDKKEDAPSTIVKHVPRRAIVFVDKHFTGDQFTVGAFRHYIQIPDDIFPPGAWRGENGDSDDEEE